MHVAIALAIHFGCASAPAATAAAQGPRPRRLTTTTRHRNHACGERSRERGNARRRGNSHPRQLRHANASGSREKSARRLATQLGQGQLKRSSTTPRAHLRLAALSPTHHGAAQWLPRQSAEGEGRCNGCKVGNWGSHRAHASLRGLREKQADAAEKNGSSPGLGSAVNRSPSHKLLGKPVLKTDPTPKNKK